jgi:hypothetical protein
MFLVKPPEEGKLAEEYTTSLTSYGTRKLCVCECEKKGVPVKGVLQYLLNALESSDCFVAHNASYGTRVTYEAFLSRGTEGTVNQFLSINCVCTKETAGLLNEYRPNSVDQSDLARRDLGTLYRFLFKGEFQGAHRAGVGVGATRRVFQETTTRGVPVRTKTVPDLLKGATVGSTSEECGLRTSWKEPPSSSEVPTQLLQEEKERLLTTVSKWTPYCVPGETTEVRVVFESHKENRFKQSLRDHNRRVLRLLPEC